MESFLQKSMSYLGLRDVQTDESEEFDEIAREDEVATSFDSDSTLPSSNAASVKQPSEKTSASFGKKMNKITTIHPKNYDEAQLVGRALRDGVPVVLNLTGVDEATAYRIVDFSSGVVFVLRGSIELVTPRVFLLSPPQVNIRVEEARNEKSHDLFR